jgi:hypothetical protein
MSAQDVDKEILEPMQRLFLSPRQMDSGQQAAALREYVAALKRFEGIDLRHAWVTVRDSHMTRAWPVPAAFVLAARQSRKDRGQDTPAKTQGPVTGSELWDRWKKVRHGEKARESVNRGVAWAYRCAILDGKFPDAINLTDLVIARESAERTAEMIETGRPIPYRGRILRVSSENKDLALKMWRNILVKNAETEAEIMSRST